MEAFLARSAKAHAGLPELERESERRGREVCRLALQVHLDTRGHGDVGAALVLDSPAGPVRLTHKRLHARRLLTIFGEVKLTRMGYGARGQPSIHPLDAQLCLPGRTYSYEICRRLTKAAICGPFAEATLGERTAMVTQSTMVAGSSGCAANISTPWPPVL